MRVIERIGGYYEAQEVDFGVVYRWCPGLVPRFLVDGVRVRRDAEPHLLNGYLRRVRRGPHGRRPRKVSRPVFGGEGPSSVALCRGP